MESQMVLESSQGWASMMSKTGIAAARKMKDGSGCVHLSPTQPFLVSQQHLLGYPIFENPERKQQWDQQPRAVLLRTPPKSFKLSELPVVFSVAPVIRLPALQH
jgi:hypothetical protein